MSHTAIQVEKLSKQYKLGQVSAGSISHDINRLWYKMRGKEDPYLTIGESNDRTKAGGSDYVWVLDDISFSVNQGDTLGIVGRNGAGKSTLLKLLSRVTMPTKGEIKIKGRIASLLEVGTGFHPDLTGRQNIFLNGAILGMNKAEIKSKLDEIIDFSGVERYIDTPVKRYSSGMYVRLAFAVAAHLEPEILIVDEVLAVGDAEFQKKCLGKMKNVAGAGRTVLFVSHNMTAVQSLCKNAILLEKGRLKMIGESYKVIDEYLSTGGTAQTQRSWTQEDAPGDDEAKVLSICIVDSQGKETTNSFLEEEIYLKIRYCCLKQNTRLNLSISIHTDKEEYILNSPSLTDEVWCGQPHPVGTYESTCVLPANLFNEGNHKANVLLVKDGRYISANITDAVDFRKVDSGLNRKNFFGTWEGIVRPILQWQTSKL